MLRELVEHGHVPALIISQPDRLQGRGRSASSPPTATEAHSLGLECWQTDDINSPEVVKRFLELSIRTLVVAAFGQMLRKPLLESLTCLNIHASLLPRYRGAAPIERALMAGETVTGVSIMRITDGLDEGPWAQRVEVPVGLGDDTGSLSRVLAVTGAVALAEVLDEVQDGTVRWTEQKGQSSYAHKLSVSDLWLDVGAGAKHAHDQVRALSPVVGARALLGQTEAKIWRTWPYGEVGLEEVPSAAAGVSGHAGKMVACDGRLFVGCEQGVIEILELQPASRARMDAAAFLRGYSACLVGEVRAAPR